MVGVSLLYLDTARLGQACSGAFQAQLDFIRLLADDPSMYCEVFFRDGSRDWPDAQRREYPGFDYWEGVESFKAQLGEHFGAGSPQDVFLASRSAQLVRTAARLMFRTCRNVLTSDLNWPHWQSIVADEAARSGQQITVVPVLDEVLGHGTSAEDLTDRFTSAFLKNECDGVFLPAVNNLGIRVPLSDLLSGVKRTGRLRFVLVDAAQSFCHLPEPSPSVLADVTITGCHKWLRGSLPLGIAACGRPLVAEQIRAILNSPGSSDLDDPLLRFSQQIFDRSVDNFAETVNVAPLFSANAAIGSPRTKKSDLAEQLCRQLANIDSIDWATDGTSWNVVKTDESLRSGIVLMRSSRPAIQEMDSEKLRARFRQHGVALSTYSHGLIRISAPAETVSEQAIDTLARAFARVA